MAIPPIPDPPRRDVTFPFKTNKVTIEGSCFNGAEVWTTGFYLGTEGADAGAPTQTNVDNIATAWQTFFTHANCKFSTLYKTHRIKMVTMNASGSTDLTTVKTHDYSPDIAGTYSVVTHVPQSALVGSLKSSIVHGKASHGRMYLPGVALPLGSDGRISATDRDAIGVKFKDFITSVRGYAGMPGFPILIAKGGTLGPAAIGKYVYSIRMGNVYDTQRRRRNGLSETFYDAAI
jgi:hypothetical protein